MTKFDPKFALEVMRRLQSEKNKEASQVYGEKFLLQAEGRIPYFGAESRQMDKRIHALWAEADSYNSVIDYLETRIWEEMTPAERTWKVLKDWEYAPSGPQLVGDVLAAQHISSAGRF